MVIRPKVKEETGTELLINQGVDVSVRTYVFHMLRTYVMILCNWLIL